MTKKKLNIKVVKASGDLEPFSYEQYTKSLSRSGLSENQIKEVFEIVKLKLYDGITTKDLYKITFKEIKKLSPTCASKYSLKESLRLLGPTGFPFEQLVAELLRHEGYAVKTGEFVKGKCITHEVDAVGLKNGKSVLVEAKFHHGFGYKTNVKVPLYIKARFDDISQAKKIYIQECYLITNTKFTRDAIDYGNCQKLKLLAWGYPKNKGIDHLINKYSLYPITALTSLSARNRKILLNSNIVVCKDFLNKVNQLPYIGISSKSLKSIETECKSLCI